MTDLRDKIIDLEMQLHPYLTYSATRIAAEEKADAILALIREEAWQPIETAPKDGTEFQAWLVDQNDEPICWEPRCRFDHHGNFQVWERVDFDLADWDTQFWFRPTHWMPQPEPPRSPESSGVEP